MNWGKILTDSTSNTSASNQMRPFLFRLWVACISLLAALPLLAPTAVLLSDVQGWTTEFSYGLIYPVMAAAVMGWVVYFAAECYLRSIYPRTTHPIPWFSCVAAVALPVFLISGELARPIVLYNPDWCRVYQISQWETSPDGSFTLVTVGMGNLTHHEISSAYLNWSGSEPAGISTIELSPMTFGWWDNREKISIDGHIEALYARLAPSGLSEDQLGQLTADIWAVLQQARNGQPISSPNAKIEPMVEAPFGDEDIYFGGIAWIATVTLLYLIVGQLTLFRAEI